jgi:hypothetical protein
MSEVWSPEAVKEYCDRRIDDHREYVEQLAQQRDKRLDEQAEALKRADKRMEGFVTVRTYDAGATATGAQVIALAGKVETSERAQIAAEGRKAGLLGFAHGTSSWVNFAFGIVGTLGGILGILGATGNL